MWGANLLATLAQVRPVDDLLPAFFALEVIGTVAAAALALRARPATIGAAALIGAGLLAVPFLLARWTTQSYYVYAATTAAAGLLLIDARARPPERTD